MKFKISLRSMAVKFILLFVSIALSWIFLEVIVRAFHLEPVQVLHIGNCRFVDNPKIIYDWMPGSEGGEINHLGLRGRDLAVKKPLNTFRIAMLGDSITQGLHEATENTFSSQLERLLNTYSRENNLGTVFEVMNCGVSGYNLEAEVETLKTKVLAYSPDIVVINFFHNDNEPIPGLQYFFVGGIMNDEQKKYLYSSYVSQSQSFSWQMHRRLCRFSKVYEMVSAIMQRYRSGNIDLALFLKQFHNSVMTSSEMEKMSVLLDEMRGFSQKNHFLFLICIHPHLIMEEHPNNALFAGIVQKKGIAYFSMIEYYKKYGVLFSDVRIIAQPRDTCHPNKRGHALIAEAFFEEFKQRGMIALPCLTEISRKNK